MFSPRLIHAAKKHMPVPATIVKYFSGVRSTGTKSGKMVTEMCEPNRVTCGTTMKMTKTKRF